MTKLLGKSSLVRYVPRRHQGVSSDETVRVHHHQRSVFCRFVGIEPEVAHSPLPVYSYNYRSNFSTILPLHMREGGCKETIIRGFRRLHTFNKPYLGCLLSE